MIFEMTADVRYPDCDSMGIVHHAVYPIWYEMARMDFFEKCGFGYEYAHSRGVDPAMVNLEMNYGSPVSFPGTVTIRTRVTLCAGKKLSFSYEVYTPGNDKPNATARSFHIWVRNGRSVNIQEELPEMFAGYAAAVEKEEDKNV